MNIKETIKLRKSIRAFLDKKIDKKDILDILEYARLSPSSTNTQPWEVLVVSGESKKALEEKILKDFDNGIFGEMDYLDFPKELNEKMKNRKVQLGKKLYTLLNVPKEDKEAKMYYWRRNFISFDAPTSLYFVMDKELEKGSFLDFGMFIYSISLLAVEKGLATCIQGSLPQYSSVIKKQLKISDDKIIVCAMAIGYEDINAKINTFTSDKEEVESFCRFYE